MVYLIAGKILRSTEIKIEVAESELSLLLKNNIMHVRNTVVSSYCILCSFKIKRIIFKQMQLLLFTGTVSKKFTSHNSIETR